MRRLAACLTFSILSATLAFAQAKPASRIGTLLDSLNNTKHIGPAALVLNRQTGALTLASVSDYTLTLQPIDRFGNDAGKRERPSICPGSNAPLPQITGLTPSPDGQHLGVLATCGDTTAVYLVDLPGNEAARQLVVLHGFAEGLEYAPDGKHLGLLYVEGATRPSGALAAMKPPSGVIGVEGLEIQRVATVDTATGRLDQVTPPGLHVYEFSWSPDAAKLAYVAAPPPGENNWWVAKLYTEELAGGRVCGDPATGCITTPGVPKAILDPVTVAGSLHGLQIAVPRWSPDSSQIAFVGGLMSDQGATGGDLYIMPSSGGDPVDLTPASQDSAVWIGNWIPGQFTYTSIAEGISQARTLLLPAAGSTAPAKSTLDFALPASIGDGRLSMSLAQQADNFAFIKSSYDAAPELWFASGGDAGCKANCYELKQITHINDELKPSWGKTESITWINEGYHVQGWLFYPPNYDPAKKYPMIVMVHGGPSSAVIPRWPYAGFGAAPFSAMGYFVLEPNPRGSYGEGEAFTQANRKDFGYGDLRDILAGVDQVEHQIPSIDDHRIGITGWSYGGFMTMFAVTQTQRFHAAVAGAGISDWLSYYGENSIDQWMTPFFGASVYDDPAVYAKSSAINFIKQVHTPTLIVVGDRDGECPAPQSFEFWHALKAEGVDTKFVVYPNEGHGFADPAHRRDVIERAVAWFDSHLQ
jgi:dipeptidyl aminopeptidase/acylaminoacyl peptidase